mgnify:CR=1 FL=1
MFKKLKEFFFGKPAEETKVVEAPYKVEPAVSEVTTKASDAVVKSIEVKAVAKKPRAKNANANKKPRAPRKPKAPKA